MIISDDADGKEKLQFIVAGGGSRIEFDIENEVINLKSDKDISICTKGDIAIQAEEISLTAKKSLSIKNNESRIQSEKDTSIESGKDIRNNFKLKIERMRQELTALLFIL